MALLPYFTEEENKAQVKGLACDICHHGASMITAILCLNTLMTVILKIKPEVLTIASKILPSAFPL